MLKKILSCNCVPIHVCLCVHTHTALKRCPENATFSYKCVWSSGTQHSFCDSLADCPVKRKYELQAKSVLSFEKKKVA